MSDSAPSVHDLLNAQTARIDWVELAPHFARGAVLRLAPDEDLVDVAASLVSDRAAEIDRLNRAGRLHRATDDDAIRWQAQGTAFWAVVVAPWVLVQEIGDELLTAIKEK